MGKVKVVNLVRQGEQALEDLARIVVGSGKKKARLEVAPTPGIWTQKTFDHPVSTVPRQMSYQQ